MIENRPATFTPFSLWERSGITEHMGGVYATRRLAEMCHVAPGERVLDVGCGTGYKACQLATHDQCRVIAFDLTSAIIHEAKRSTSAARTDKEVNLLQANAIHIPLPVSAVDCVNAESVLVFCDLKGVLSEVYRVLRPDGVLGANELTLLSRLQKPCGDCCERRYTFKRCKQGNGRLALRRPDFLKSRQAFIGLASRSSSPAILK